MKAFPFPSPSECSVLGLIMVNHAQDNLCQHGCMNADKCAIDPEFKCFNKQQTLLECTTIKTVLVVYGYQSKNVWLAITHSKIGWLQINHNLLTIKMLHCFIFHIWIKSRINILTVRLKSAQAYTKIHCPVFTPRNSERNCMEAEAGRKPRHNHRIQKFTSYL